jgi:hypothetical protein
MSDSDSALLFRAAVLNCLARCKDSYTPLNSVCDFLEKLTEMGWNDHDVQAVWMTVVPLLERSPSRWRCGRHVGRQTG